MLLLFWPFQVPTQSSQLVAAPQPKCHKNQRNTQCRRDPQHLSNGNNRALAGFVGRLRDRAVRLPHQLQKRGLPVLVDTFYDNYVRSGAAVGVVNYHIARELFAIQRGWFAVSPVYAQRIRRSAAVNANWPVKLLVRIGAAQGVQAGKSKLDTVTIAKLAVVVRNSYFVGVGARLI